MAEAPAEPSWPAISGGVEVEIKENASGDWGSKTTLGAGISAEGMAFGGFNFESVDGGGLSLDEWQLGTDMGEATVSLGKQGDIWIGAEGEHTIANPKMDESVQISMGDFAMAVEFGDWQNDVTDIEAIAGSYSLGDITVAGDYDLDSENIVLGSRMNVGDFGGAVTYDVDAEHFAYEVDGTTGSITAYINGDQDDVAQNIGAKYTWELNGIGVEPKVNYDIEDEEFTPQVTVGFSF